jgi:DNA replication protein DnaC
MAQQINEALHRLAKRLNLIDDGDTEPYLLTKEEEELCISNAISREKDHVRFKMAQLLKTKEEIDFKMSQIDWNERINVNAILNLANSIKNHDQWIKEKHIKDKEEEVKKRKALEEYWTAKKIYNLMAWTSQNEFNKKLVVNNDNRKFITAICFFLSNDPRFETELNLSFKKGLLIRGTSGVGKTHIVRCVEKNGLYPILTLSMLDINFELQAYGEYEIKLGDNKMIYLDDVGTEETPAMHFGNKIHFFKNTIEGLYLKRGSIFRNLIVSTNLNFKDIEDKYGFRVASRMREMFNVIDVTGKDMRNNG